ncbi:MAG: SAM-dependent chlorinase/fluorinase, partial [Phycisphaerae bacterium]|nr:SAM-dependent chlorinase/fluorinase [Phycisphaerae bacterium]
MGKMAPHRIVTLLTDFGTRDPYVAAMKGAILQTCPQAHMVDLCHDVPPHNILAGAFTLAHAVPYFPPGTLHVVVVDPGVGTERNILAARFGKHTFLFPDNGVISLVAEVLPLRSLHT